MFISILYFLLISCLYWSLLVVFEFVPFIIGIDIFDDCDMVFIIGGFFNVFWLYDLEVGIGVGGRRDTVLIPIIEGFIGFVEAIIVDVDVVGGILMLAGLDGIVIDWLRIVGYIGWTDDNVV